MTALRKTVVAGIVLIALFIIFAPLFFKETQSELRLLSMPNIPVTPNADQFSQGFNNTNPVMKNPFKFPLAPAQAWVLQLADFEKNSTAQRLVQILRQKGFKAYAYQILLPPDVQQHHNLKGEGYATRVFVGPEIKPDNIKILATQLRDELSLNSTVTVFDPLLLPSNVEKNREDSL